MREITSISFVKKKKKKKKGGANFRKLKRAWSSVDWKDGVETSGFSRS